MLFGWIVRKYSADLILLTKFKKLIGVKEKFAQNMEVPVSLMKFLLQTLGSFGGFFCLTFYILRWLLGEQDFRSSLVWFLGDKIRNSNEFQRIYFQFAFNTIPSVLQGTENLNKSRRHTRSPDNSNTLSKFNNNILVSKQPTNTC